MIFPVGVATFGIFAVGVATFGDRKVIFVIIIIILALIRAIRLLILSSVGSAVQSARVSYGFIGAYTGCLSLAPRGTNMRMGANTGQGLYPKLL